MVVVTPCLRGTSLSFWVQCARPLTPGNLRPLPTVAFFHPPCFLPVSLGIASSPWGITPGSLLPPLPLPFGPLHSGVCYRVSASPPALECVPLEGCLLSRGSASSPFWSGCSLSPDVRGALQRMFERKMAVEQPVKAKINVQVRIKMCKV